MSNGGSLENLFDRIAASLAKINGALGSIQSLLLRVHDLLKETSDRREREYEALRQGISDIKQSIVVLGQQVVEARSDLKDITPPLGVAIHKYRERKDSDGGFKIDERSVQIPKAWFAWASPLAVKILIAAGGIAALASGWVYHWLQHGPR